jgi:hypothetical protein
LTGKALVDAFDRMLERRLEGFTADVVAALHDALREERGAKHAAVAHRIERSEVTPRAKATGGSDERQRVRFPPAAPTPTAAENTKGARRVLAAVAQHMPEGVTSDQLSILTGYKKSTRDLYVQMGIRRGWLVREGRLGATMRSMAGLASPRSVIYATAAGERELGPDFERLPTGEKLRAHWLGKLPEGERRLLAFVVPFYPHPVSKERIGEATGYRKSTRDLYIQKLRRRRLLEETGRGFVVAASQLFDAPTSDRAAGAEAHR